MNWLLRQGLFSIASMAAAGLAVVLLGGLYNLSATEQHPAWLYRVIALGRETFVSLDAAGTRLPAGFRPLADAEGAMLFERHCAQCHGAPGVAPAEFALGMMPAAPPLAQVGRDRPPGEVLWFIRKGLKMSGMPAWETRLTEAEMLRLTAFVAALPQLAPIDYRRLAGRPAPSRRAAGEPEPGAGDPERGRLVMQVHACRTCHLIPGLPGAADARVGPSLAEAGSRRYIAGILPNTRSNMIRWLTDPPAADPLTAMPDLGLSPAQAADVAAYLYRLAPAPASEAARH